MKKILLAVMATGMLFIPACRKDATSEAQTQQQLEEARKKLEEAEKEAAEARRQLEEAQRAAEQARQQKEMEEARRKLEQAQRQAEAARKKLEAAQQKAAGGQAPQSSPATAAQAPAAPAPKPVTVPAGTPIVIRTTTALSTKDAKSGDTFRATLAEPLVVDGVTIAAKGADVEGVIVESDPGGRVKGLAQIAVALRRIHTAAGPVDIQTGSYAAEAKSSVKKDVTRGAIMTGVGAAIGAIAGGGRGAAVGAGVGAGAGTATAMATRGEPAAIPAESVLTFRLKAPFTVTVK